MSELKPGSFYWVRPVFDVDFTPPGGYELVATPARPEMIERGAKAMAAQIGDQWEDWESFSEICLRAALAS